MIDSGGDVGEEMEEGCVPGMDTEEIIGTGEFIGTASVSCSTQHNPFQSFLYVFVALFIQWNRKDKRTYENT